MEEYKHLSYASSLCGNCTEVCPLKINIHEMLLENRTIAAGSRLNNNMENFSWSLWQQAMLSRRLMNIAGPGIKNTVVNKLFKGSWAQHRGEIKFAERSFNKIWKDREQQ
jgi:L-lactate dehydrogenase complex protein LldF